MQSGKDVFDRAIRLVSPCSTSDRDTLSKHSGNQEAPEDPQVICLIVHERRLQLRTTPVSRAYLVHGECFGLLDVLLQHFDDHHISSVEVAWAIARSMSPSYTAGYPWEHQRRRSAILQDAAAGEHFSTLSKVFERPQSGVSNLFKRVAELPVELRTSISTHLDNEMIHHVLITMQLLTEVAPLLISASSEMNQSLDTEESLYAQWERFAGREYLVRLHDSPFNRSVALPKTSDSTRMFLEFDEVGIVSFACGQQRGIRNANKGMRRQPSQTWHYSSLATPRNYRLLMSRKVGEF